MLVANKADTLDMDTRAETHTLLETLGRQFNLDGYAFLNATSTHEVKNLVSDITQAAISQHNFFANEAKLRKKMLVEIQEKIKSLSQSTCFGFLKNKALNDEKKNRTQRISK
jgi:hypothetical protein